VNRADRLAAPNRVRGSLPLKLDCTAMMVEQVPEFAKENVEQVVLSAITSTEHACRFYRKTGFETGGRMKAKALRCNDLETGFSIGCR
jgi:hypothetical protein